MGNACNDADIQDKLDELQNWSDKCMATGCIL